jgi:5,10-methenyltetrahydrofolate synthetase
MKDWNEITAWRKARRAELIGRRASVDPALRRRWNERMTALLEAGFAVLAGRVVGFCWPYKGEFDTRFAIRYWRDRGATAALPEVVAKGQPLRFRKWWPGAPTAPGVYDIPVPAGTEVVVPEAAVVPMNGFDEQGYRLGYGGAYFDLTLAALDPRPLAIGVSFEFARLPTIFPQPHDIPMDFVVTEAGIYRGGGNPLALLDVAASAAEAQFLLEQREARRHHGSAAGASAVGPTAAAGYSSPACYAHEVAPEYFGQQPALSAAELAGLLNTLLEAERAGAKVLAAFLEDYERDTPAWRQLSAVQRDEARNCAILIELIRRIGGIASVATGDFLEKALKIEGRIARLQFLNRGQGWVARKISEALPAIEDASLRRALADMYDSHRLNIEACEALIETLES